MQPCERLTPKEMQVATLVWEGLTNRQIAAIIGTSEQVVKNYLRTTFDKLGVLEPTGTGAVCRSARRCSLAGYTEHAFAIRFAAGPTWCFAAAGLRIRFLRQIRAAGFMTCDSNRELLTNPDSRSPSLMI
jgi:hypothetical protein